MTDSATRRPAAGNGGGLAGSPGRVSRAGGTRNGTVRGTVAATDSPPWHGAVNVGLLFAAAAWIITYTLLPLPGQVDLGDWNYVGGAACFVTAMVLSRVLRVSAERRSHAERAARSGA